MPLPARQQVASTPSEADTCREYVTPKLVTVGWDTEPHSLAEQRTFTDGRIVVALMNFIVENGLHAWNAKANPNDAYQLSSTGCLVLRR